MAYPLAPTSDAKQRLPELDLLRFCAALSVAFYHLCKWPPSGGEELKGIAQLGFLGVQVFFMISGFVILMTAEHRTAVEFAKSRIARLYPTFWICVLVTSAALWGYGDDPSPKVIVANLTMLPRLFHQPFVDLVYWTLEVELRFYALVLVLVVFRQMARVEFWLGVWLTILCVSHLGVPPALLRISHVLQWLSLQEYGSLFAAGCYLYLLRSRGPSWRYFAPLAVCLGLSIFDVCSVQDGSRFPWSRLDLLAMGAFVCVAYAVFVTLSLKLWQLPASKLWYWLGGLTYPLYLLHAQAGHVLWEAIPLSGWARSAWVLVTALLAAAILAHYSERRACKALLRALDELELRARRAWSRRVGPVRLTNAAAVPKRQPPKISVADRVIK